MSGLSLHKLLCLTILLVLVGCQTPTPASQPPVVHTSAPTNTPPPTWTATLSPTALPPVTLTPAPTATSTPQPTAASACPPVIQLNFSTAEPLHDLLVFTSAAPAPFLHRSAQQVLDTRDVWGLATDGQHSGQLSRPEGGVDVRRAEDGTPQITLLTNRPITIESPYLTVYDLPAVCNNGQNPCSDFAFSPGGDWVAFYWGPDLCGRGIMAYNIQTGATISYTNEGGHDFHFVSDDTLLVAAGHCEGGTVRSLSLPGGERTTLGNEGKTRWNSDETAFVIEAVSYDGWQRAVWGYTLTTQNRFIATNPESTFSSQPLWTPPETHVLYEQRDLLTTTVTTTLRFGPKSIIRTAADGSERTVLASDPAFDYHLCTAPLECSWVGDWIEVRRVPYTEASGDYTAGHLNAVVKSAPCFLYGELCDEPPERLALNGQTGELIPWESLPQPTPSPPPATPTPTPLPDGPDLSLPALYTATDDRYALYLGLDQQSVWCVPATGDPVAWANHIDVVFYVP